MLLDSTAAWLTGTLMLPEHELPEWAQAQLWVSVWDRDHGPGQELFREKVRGKDGTFIVMLSDDLVKALAFTGQRQPPYHLVTVGWGEALDPVLAYLAFPENWASRQKRGETISLDWVGAVTQIGYVEQLHYLDIDNMQIAVIELAGYAAPYTYTRLPELPVSFEGDRHTLHADRPFGRGPEQITYMLVEADSPLAAVAQDALVTRLQVAATGSLGAQQAEWHEIVNIPLLLEALTVIAP